MDTIEAAVRGDRLPPLAFFWKIELFGTGIAPFAAIASIVSFVMAGHRSVYPSQVLAIAKTPSLRVRPGVELAVHGDVLVRPVRFPRLGLARRAVRRRWRRRVRKGSGPADAADQR